jgi:uncharacterized protein
MPWLLGLLAGYLGLCALAFAFQARLVFPAPAGGLPVPPGAVLVPVPGGTHLLWWEAPGHGPVVVHFHGNAEQVAGLDGLARAFVARGVSFAAVEYPGYPGAGGAPSEAALLSAAERALAHLAGPRGVARERLVLQGQSLGTGVAVAMAARGWGRRVVLLSPYTSLSDVGARALPWLPVRWLLRDRFDAARWASSVTVPVLVVHGRRDDVIPVELGRAVASRFRGARVVEVPEAGHHELWEAPQTTAEVFAFVAAGG